MREGKEREGGKGERYRGEREEILRLDIVRKDQPLQTPECAECLKEISALSQQELFGSVTMSCLLKTYRNLKERN